MIIDTHTHMADGKYGQSVYGGFDAHEMLDVMDNYGVDKVWISSVSGLSGNGEFSECNDDLFNYCRLDENRFKGFMTVNPNYRESCVDEIRRCCERYGFRGLKLHPWLQAFTLTMPAMGYITEECIKQNLVMIFHDGTPPYSSTLQVADLAARYPEARIILGHSGIIEMYDDAISACRRHKNIYLTLCGPSIFQLQKIINNACPDRLMFGSDFGFSRNVNPLKYRLDMWNHINIDDSLKNKIFYENAAHLIT